MLWYICVCRQVCFTQGDKEFEPTECLTVKRDSLFRPKGMVRLPRRAGFYLIGMVYSFAVAKGYFFVAYAWKIIKKDRAGTR